MSAAEIDVGVDILGTEVNDAGTISCQTGDVLTRQVACANVEWWQHAGFASRPPKAEPGKGACQAVAIIRSDRDVAIASRDIRSHSILGNLKEGETCVYGAGPDGNAQGKVSIKASGNVFLSTKVGNEATGRDVYCLVSPEKGFEVSTPWGHLRLGPLGFHVLHSSEARIDLGAIAGLPPPFDVLSSYASIDAGATTIKGGAVSLGTDGGAASEAAVTALIVFIGQLIDAIALINPSTPGAAALATSLLPPSGTATATLLKPLLSPIGKVV